MGTHYFRYDTYGRMVFSQSPVERKAGRCRFYIYDGGARNVVSGICNDSSMPAEGTDAPAYNASLDISGKSVNIIGDTGYDAGTMAMSISRADPQILTVDYYDTYDFVQLPGMPSSFTMRDPKYGLLTGRIERVLEPDDTDPSVSKRNATRYLRSHMCYDDLGRATRTTSDLSYGPTSVVTTDYNRVSQPVTETFTILNLDRFEEINPRPTHTLHYTYDRLGRQKSVSATIGDSADVTLKDVAYDAYGRVASSACDGLATKFTYDISSRVTGAAGDFFDDRIARSAAGAVTGIRTYFMFRKFEGENTLYSYDGAGRLTGSTTIITNLTSPKTGQPRNSAYTYDRNSNVTAVRRRGPVMFSYADNTPLRWGDVDDITMTYDGNRLRKASDAATSPLIESSYDFTDGADESVEYLYDADGRLTDDLNRGISVEWNATGQPLRIHLADGRWIAYGYTASGTKIFEELREHAPVRQTPEMATSGMTPGNFGTEVDPSLLSQYPVDTGKGYRILENRGYFGAWETEGYSLRRINLPGAYWADGKLHAMHIDWQGNIRGVSTGTKMKQHNIFYPYGMLAADSREPAMNRYKYGAKEFETRDAANFAYHGARLLYHDLMRFFSPDQLAEANPGVSPYSYCAADPINAIDQDGNIVIYVNGLDAFGAQPAGAPYWGGRNSAFVKGAAEFFNDNNLLFIPVKYFPDIKMREAISVYLSAATTIPLKIDPNSNFFASNRYQMGYDYAKQNITEITASLNENETIKLVGHSMGCAFIEGMAKYFTENDIPVSHIVHINAFQGDKFSSVNSDQTETIEYLNYDDPVIMRLSPSYFFSSKGIKNVDHRIREFSPGFNLLEKHAFPLSENAKFWETLKRNIRDNDDL